ncbi:MAG: ion transporter [Candidatus Glassbacteria bacterium]|nr:ion transporter [Candidatus Glassbacteria bacterium]
MSRIKERVAFYLEDCTTTAGKLIELSLLTVNLAACVLFVIITYHSLDEVPAGLVLLELGMVAVFAIEYLLRLWTAELKLRFALSFFGIVDLLSILPIFFQVHTLGFVRSLRALRILRFTRFLESEVFFFGRLSRLQLQIVRVLFTIFTVMFIWAGFIHYAETGAPGGTIHNFGDAFYFAIVTLSTVGFGDIIPVTQTGRWFTALMISSGVVLIPWQASRLVQVMVETGTRRKNVTCRQCGLTGHEPDSSYCRLCGGELEAEIPGGGKLS